MRIMETHADAVYGNTYLFSENAKVKFSESKNDIARGLLFDFLGAYHTTFLISKECFAKYGLFLTHTEIDQEFKLANDYMWFVIAIQNGFKAVKEPEIVGNFSLGGASSIERIELIKEGKEVAVLYSRNLFERISVMLVWNLRLTCNLFRHQGKRFIQLLSCNLE